MNIINKFILVNDSSNVRNFHNVPEFPLVEITRRPVTWLLKMTVGKLSVDSAIIDNIKLFPGSKSLSDDQSTVRWLILFEKPV